VLQEDEKKTAETEVGRLQVCQRQSLVSIFSHIFHLCQVSVNCLQNAENTVCVNICLGVMASP